jgi:hypothetical protein
MHRSIRCAGRWPALFIFTVVSALTSVSWAASTAETVTISGADLQAKANHYAELETFYRERATAGSKHMITYFTAANRADHLAQRYRLAAAEAGHRG